MSGKFEEMEVFARIYESGGLSAAARLTGLTPSGVSRLIKRLEARLGAQLFHRNSRSLQPTPEGEVFYRHCVEIMQCLEHAEAAIAPAHGGSTVLRVNTLPTFAVYQLAKVMPEFHERHPRIRVEFILGAAPANAVGERIDVAIYSGRQPDSSLVSRRLADIRWKLLASPAYLAEHGTPSQPADLVRHRCLNFTLSTVWNTWRFRDPNFTSYRPDAIMGSDHGDMLMELALQGMGIARLADFHTHEVRQSGRLVPILDGQLDQRDEPLYLLYRSGSRSTPRVAAWLDFMQEKFGGTSPW